MSVFQMPRAKEYVRRLRERLPDARVSHSIFTAEYLSSFAEDIEVDHDEAVEAGLLHDYSRDLKKNEFLEKARELRLPISETQLEKPSLLHGPIAAEMCRNEFDIGNNVYEAIYWHTTGRPGLGLLGQALFVADFAEPMRTFSEAATARHLLKTDGFRAALLYVTEMKIIESSQKQVIDPNTEAFMIWLKTHP